MPWLGIWFEHEAAEGKARSPEWFRGLAEPVVYPYVHSFVEGEESRLRTTRDPGRALRDGRGYEIYYSINHDGGQSALDQQGCHILHWLFEHFAAPSDAADGASPPDSRSLSARFNEIPVVIHSADPVKAAALANALALLRFLGAGEDQAVAKIMIHPWNPFCGSPRLAAENYEKRVLEFLHGGVFYPEGVGLFDVLDRHDLRSHRQLPACCLTQIGFVGPLLEWIDECRPESPGEREDLERQLRNSLADEARYRRKHRRSRENTVRSLETTFR